MSGTIVRMKFGSHLYGTSTPDSDTDYKGVFMPTREQVCLGVIPKAINEQTKKRSDRKNGPDDVDTEMYSLHHFVHLALMGETVALDMLHSREWEDFDEIWVELHERRAEFYTTNLRALVGYARRQAAKYGIKGSRLEEAKRVLEYLAAEEAKSPGIRLEDIWDGFPTGEHIHKEERTFPETLVTVSVCGKQLQSTATARIYIESMSRFVDAYGARAREAESNKGIDWKAVSHAFRAGFQVEHILVDHDFSYPLPETDFILAVKRGTLDYTTVVAPALDALMDRVEALSEASTLPKVPNVSRWNAWLAEKVYQAL